MEFVDIFCSVLFFPQRVALWWTWLKWIYHICVWVTASYLLVGKERKVSSNWWSIFKKNLKMIFYFTSQDNTLKICNWLHWFLFELKENFPLRYFHYKEKVQPLCPTPQSTQFSVPILCSFVLGLQKLINEGKEVNLLFRKKLLVMRLKLPFPCIIN